MRPGARVARGLTWLKLAVLYWERTRVQIAVATWGRESPTGHSLEGGGCHMGTVYGTARRLHPTDRSVAPPPTAADRARRPAAAMQSGKSGAKPKPSKKKCAALQRWPRARSDRFCGPAGRRTRPGRPRASPSAPRRASRPPQRPRAASAVRMQFRDGWRGGADRWRAADEHRRLLRHRALFAFRFLVVRRPARRLARRKGKES